MNLLNRITLSLNTQEEVTHTEKFHMGWRRRTHPAVAEFDHRSHQLTI